MPTITHITQEKELCKLIRNHYKDDYLPAFTHLNNCHKLNAHSQLFLEGIIGIITRINFTRADKNIVDSIVKKIKELKI